jgi:hypothetical protein
VVRDVFANMISAVSTGLLKNTMVAFFNLAKCRAKLGTARKLRLGSQF